MYSSVKSISDNSLAGATEVDIEGSSCELENNDFLKNVSFLLLRSS